MTVISAQRRQISGRKAPAPTPTLPSWILAGSPLALSSEWPQFVVTRRGGTLVLAAKPEFERLALNRFESDRWTFNASPIVAHDRLYLRSDRHLYSIGKKS